jgi:integrase
MATVVARRRSGEGLIRQRADGRWEARIRLGLHRRSIYGRTEQDVRLELTKLLADRDAGRPVIRRTVQVGPWLRRWVESHPVRETSRAQYRYVIERYLVPELGRVRLADLRKIHIEEAFERIADRPKARGQGRISAGTVAAAHRALSAGLSAAVENDLLAYNVARRVHPPRTEREIVPPGPDAIDGRFEALAGEELAPLFLLLRWSGCRLGAGRNSLPTQLQNDGLTGGAWASCPRPPRRRDR